MVEVIQYQRVYTHILKYYGKPRSKVSRADFISRKPSHHQKKVTFRRGGFRSIKTRYLVIACVCVILNEKSENENE